MKKVIGNIVAAVIVLIGIVLVGGIKGAMGTKSIGAIPALLMYSPFIASFFVARFVSKRIQGVGGNDKEEKSTDFNDRKKLTTNKISSKPVSDGLASMVAINDEPPVFNAGSGGVKLKDEVSCKMSNEQEDLFFEQALTEYQDGSYHKATYAKSVVLANGNENKLMPAYIESRTMQLLDEHNKMCLIEEEEAKTRRLGDEYREKIEYLKTYKHKIFAYWSFNKTLVEKIISNKSIKLKKDIKEYSLLSDVVKDALLVTSKNLSDYEIAERLKPNNLSSMGVSASLIYEALDRGVFLEDYFDGFEVKCTRCNRSLGSHEVICSVCGSENDLDTSIPRPSVF